MGVWLRDLFLGNSTMSELIVGELSQAQGLFSHFFQHLLSTCTLLGMTQVRGNVTQVTLRARGHDILKVRAWLAAREALC
jgi:hypothetical protein